MFEAIQANNPHIPLFHVESESFLPYGKIMKREDLSGIIHYMGNTAIPEEGNIYVASVDEMEQLPVSRKIEATVYGQMDIQVGYCNGRNSHLNGLEYHKGSEINIAVTDLVLLLGKVQDIVDNRYSTQNVEGFFVPKGTVIEIYQTTLHFAPCKVHQEGFKCVVILPKGTNTPLDNLVDPVREEDQLLWMKNKWLLAHPDKKALVERGVHPGIVGTNLEILL